MKQTIVSHIGITRMGILEIQMRKQLVDGDQTHELGFHRVSAAPGADLEQVLAAVNADLTRMGMAEITTEEWDDVRATSAVAWTEKKRQAFADMIQQQLDADATRVAQAQEFAKTQGASQ